MAIVGPGAQPEQAEEAIPLLEGASEFEYVTVLNPLTDDFAVRVAQDVPVNMPVEIRAKTGLIRSDTDVARTYGFDLKGRDFVGRKHIVNDTIIKAGQTKNFKGNDAQVAVRQIVNEVLQREGKTRLSADPNLRREVEERVIIHRGPIQDLMEAALRTQRSQLDDAIDQSNKEQDEQPFPQLNRSNSGITEASQHSGADATAPKRGTGRRRKTASPDQTASQSDHQATVV